MLRIGFIGGGPGGLMTADLINRQYGDSCSVTVFEMASRPGGKLKTLFFSAARVPYESGVAELYDLSSTGPDPLRELVEELGLAVRPMKGQTMVLEDRVLRRDSASLLSSPVLHSRNRVHGKPTQFAT
jgi:protoporphyrinogen oxidase